MDELAPGGYVELELSTTIWFNSALELVEFSKLGAFVDVAYYLTDISVVALEGSTTTIPYDVVVERKERDYLVDKLIKEEFEKLYGKKTSGSLGGTLIEVIGDGIGLSSWMIKGAKTVLKLQHGETDHKLTISMDDGLGNEDSIYNDILYVTTGNGTNALIDTLNGTKLTIEAGEVSIQAKGPGNTKIKIGITDSAGKMEREYIMDIVVEDIVVKNTITLSPDSMSGSFNLDENSFKVAVKQKREQENEVYSENPFLWFDSTLVLDVSTMTSDSSFSLHVEKAQLEEILDQTATTDVVVDGNVADLSFDREALKTVIESNGELYTIIARKLTDEEALKLGSTNPTWQLTIQNGDDMISQFGEGTVDVSVPYEPKDTEDISVEHIKEDGTTEILYAEYDKKTGTVNFTTDGFSHFRIIENTGSSSEHTYEAPKFIWSENNTTCTAIFTCSDGDDTQTIECTVTSKTTKEPTCTEKGKVVYTAEAVFNEQTYIDSKEEEIDAVGHSFENDVCVLCGAVKDNPDKPIDPDKCEHTYIASFEWSDDSTTCKAAFTCKDCGETHVADATVTIEETPATCTENGQKTYIATAEYEGTTAQDTGKTEIIPATGHKYVDTVVEPTETEQGYTEHVCSVCGDTYRDAYTDPTGTDNPDNSSKLSKILEWIKNLLKGNHSPGNPEESESPSEPEQPSESETQTESEQPSESESSSEDQNSWSDFWDWLLSWWK